LSRCGLEKGIVRLVYSHEHMVARCSGFINVMATEMSDLRKIYTLQTLLICRDA